SRRLCEKTSRSPSTNETSQQVAGSFHFDRRFPWSLISATGIDYNILFVDENARRRIARDTVEHPRLARHFACVSTVEVANQKLSNCLCLCQRNVNIAHKVDQARLVHRLVNLHRRFPVFH
ncbi:hypothetical protein, partial [Paraburkholderia tropica]|uniref:hypothetical protein n=1 Tax=Paraburkholderia tropica TaxID=92647 RepID=UPI001CC37A0D